MDQFFFSLEVKWLTPLVFTSKSFLLICHYLLSFNQWNWCPFFLFLFSWQSKYSQYWYPYNWCQYNENWELGWFAKTGLRSSSWEYYTFLWTSELRRSFYLPLLVKMIWSLKWIHFPHFHEVRTNVWGVVIFCSSLLSVHFSLSFIWTSGVQKLQDNF